MDSVIRLAKAEESENIVSFYHKLIDDITPTEYYPKWKKGIYPDDEYIRSSVRKGEMYIALSGENQIGAMVINHHTTDGYATAKWNVSAGEKDVSIIHILCVSPEYSRLGIGKKMVKAAIDICRKNGQKAVRLDVLRENLPAQKLYRSMGFVFIERIKLFYEVTGLCDFDLYEYAL